MIWENEYTRNRRWVVSEITWRTRWAAFHITSTGKGTPRGSGGDRTDDDKWEFERCVWAERFRVFYCVFFSFSLYTQIGRKRQISFSRRWVSSKCERERWQSINLLLIVICMRRGLRFSFEFEFVFVFELRMRLGHTQLVLLPVVAAVVELLLLSFNGVQRWHNNILLCILLFAVLYFFLAI